MKQSKQSQLIHIWEDYEFYLSIPKTFTGSNKPYVYYYYLDAKTTKSIRIRKYIGKNDGNIKSIRDEAKKLLCNNPHSVRKAVRNNYSYAHGIFIIVWMCLEIAFQYLSSKVHSFLYKASRTSVKFDTLMQFSNGTSSK